MNGSLRAAPIQPSMSNASDHEESTEHARIGSAEADGEATERYEEALERFVLFWGEMASNWGINRTMAQIHALLYCAEEPLDTDAIMERLQISRGNANMNLRSLITWDLVRKVHRADSRKDFYEAEKDVWHITAQIIKERERREIKPVREQLQACRDLLKQDAERCADLPEREEALCHRLENLMDLMEVFEGFFETLLPYVQEENVSAMKHLIRLADTLPEEEDGS
jgi:DNA-binding transcriptional regulator GbsR (MarR family)